MAASSARTPLLALVGVLSWLALAAACSAAPTPTPSPTPTPTPVPAPSAQELLDRMIAGLLELETVRFTLTPEAGGPDLGGGMLLAEVGGVALDPAGRRCRAAWCDRRPGR